MQTLTQVVAELAARYTHDYVILKLHNQGGSGRTSFLLDVFNPDQIEALENDCLISQQRSLPEKFNTPENIQAYLELNDATLVTITWKYIQVDGSTFECDIDNRQIF